MEIPTSIYFNLATLIEWSVVILMFALVIFSAVMLFDCIRRNHSQFKLIFTQNSAHEKIIWAFLIVLSAKIFGTGAIAYYYFVKRGKINKT